MGDELYRPAPDVWDGTPVSPAAFDALSRPPGWKYELWDGRLRLEPDWRYEVARYVGPVPEAEAPAGAAVRPVDSGDANALVDAADAAFANGPDYFGFPLGVRRRQLREAVEDALGLEPAWIRRAHRTAQTAGR